MVDDEFVQLVMVVDGDVGITLYLNGHRSSSESRVGRSRCRTTLRQATLDCYLLVPPGVSSRGIPCLSFELVTSCSREP